MPSENPYPPGSARYKLWERREADRRAKAKPAPKKGIDDEVREELERRPQYFKRRDNQSTDSSQ